MRLTVSQIPIEEIRELYINEQMGVKRIAMHFHVDHSNLRKRMKKEGIPFRTHLESQKLRQHNPQIRSGSKDKPRKFFLTQEELYDFYIVQEMSIEEIALLTSVTRGTVYHNLRLKGITIRDRTKNQKHRVEDAILLHQRKRAKDLELPANLTLDQWLETLNYFKWKCAYCGGKYTVLEHFIPLTHNSGTTQSNCVPACQKCNVIKGPYHPLAMSKNTPKWMKEAINQVQQYLQQWSGSVEEYQ